VFFPNCGASAHFCGSSSWKMSINAVFVHFICRSALKLCIRSSFFTFLTLIFLSYTYAYASLPVQAFWGKGKGFVAM
jgi:hypothetical protein